MGGGGEHEFTIPVAAGTTPVTLGLTGYDRRLQSGSAYCLTYAGDPSSATP